MGLNFLMLKLKGGPGSGHHDHRGIPGQRGGSSSSRLSSKAVFMDEGVEYAIGDKYSKLIDEFAAAHPKEALEGIEKIVVVSGSDELEDLAFSLGHDIDTIENISGAAAVYFWESKTMGLTTALVSKEELRHDFDHEVGHHVWSKALESFGSGIDGWNVYYDNKPKFGRPSEYAKKNSEEGFAETYHKYLRDKNSLSTDEINRVEYILEDIGVET